MRTGITGGIGSGKSFVCRLLKERGVSVYDCDSAAKRLMVTSPTLRRQLTKLIGPETYIKKKDAGTRKTEYLLNKPVIARFLMSSPENAKALENIVHPAVIDDYLNSGIEWVESAILFESGLDHYVDRIVVVTAPEALRIARIMERDGITREKAQEWIDHQLPQDYLVRHADRVIVNDEQTPLLPQLEAFPFMQQ